MPPALCSPHASLSLLHFPTYSHSKQDKTQQKRAISRMLTFSVTHTCWERRCWPICLLWELELSKQKNQPLPASHFHSFLLRGSLSLSLSLSPIAAPPTPLSPKPLQHQAETNIPVEIQSYNKLTFTLKSHQLPSSLCTSSSSSLHVFHGYFVLFLQFCTYNALRHIFKLCSVYYTIKIIGDSIFWRILLSTVDTRFFLS